MNSATDNLKRFLQYIAIELINYPEKAELRVAELENNQINFRFIVKQSDVALLIGKGGYTISAIRSLCKAIAETHNSSIRIQICSREEAEKEKNIESKET